MENQINCRYCGKNIIESDYFCPNCGKKLKDKPLSTGIVKQISVYLFSVFLPPFGLWPGIKYLRQEGDKSKIIGIIVILLTIISTGVSIWLTIGFINVFNQQLNSNINLYR